MPLVLSESQARNIRRHEQDLKSGSPPLVHLVPASVPRLVYQSSWYVLSCLWDGTYKITIAANPCSGGSGFLISLSGSLPYVRHTIIVNKVLSAS